MPCVGKRLVTQWSLYDYNGERTQSAVTQKRKSAGNRGAAVRTRAQHQEDVLSRVLRFESTAQSEISATAARELFEDVCFIPMVLLRPDVLYPHAHGLRKGRLRLDEIRDVHDRLQRSMGSLFPRDPTEWRRGRVEIWPVQIDHIGLAVDEHGQWQRDYHPAGWKDSFWLGVIALLEVYGERIRRCLDCAQLFLRQKRQQYCSPQCSQRVRSARYYEAHAPQERDRRHAAYVEARRRQYPHVKVVRRPRTR